MTHLACLALGFLGGFTFGFRVAIMVRLGVQPRPQSGQVLEELAP